MSSSIRLTLLPLTFFTVLAGTSCGGQVKAAPGNADPTSVEPTTSACPAPHVIVELGAACAWSQECTVDLDPCHDGEGSATAVTCAGSVVSLPSGTGISCAHTIDAGVRGPLDATAPSFVCPSPEEVGSGAACSTLMSCEGTVGPCGALESCDCVDGLWSCGAVSCGTGPGSGTGTGDDAGGGACHKAPPPVVPEIVAGVYCPFSAVDGGVNVTCAPTQDCCEPSSGLSVCVTGGAECPVPVSTDWQCEGAPDCAAQAGTVCCGDGVIEQQQACGSVPPYAYVAGFVGSSCSAACAGPTSFQICSQDSECPGAAPGSCAATEAKGLGIGYCIGS